MNKDKFNKFIIIFLFLNPFLDAFTAIQLKYNIGFVTIGTLLRGLFFLIILLYMIKNNICRKYLIIFIIYVVLALSYDYFILNSSLFTESSNLMLIFYLPVLILFFKENDNKSINDKLIFILYMIYVNLVIIPYILGIGFNTYPDVYHRNGFLGLFYAGNELSALFIGLLPIVFNYLLHNEKYIIKIPALIEIVIAIFMVGTKTLALGFIIVVLYFIVKLIKENYKNISSKTKKIVLGLAIVVALLVVFITPKTPMYKNLKITFKFYHVYKPTDLFKVKNIDDIVFSSRLSYLKKVNKYYIKQKPIKMIFGLGREKLMKIKDIEIDIFDIFYSTGIIGSIIYIVLMFIGFKNSNIKKEYKFSLILFILMSLISGHVLIRPMVSIYIALLFSLSKKKV